MKFFLKQVVLIFIVYVFIFFIIDYLFSGMKISNYDSKKLFGLILKSLVFALIFGYIRYRNQVKKNN